MEYINPNAVRVKDVVGNQRLVRAYELWHDKVTWLKADGSFKPGTRERHGPPKWKKPRRSAPLDLKISGHYVYVVSLHGEVVYIGKGFGKRMHHVYSGRSTNKELNRLYFQKAPVIAEVYMQNLSNAEASFLEKQMLDYYRPRFNQIIYNLDN